MFFKICVVQKFFCVIIHFMPVKPSKEKKEKLLVKEENSKKDVVVSTGNNLPFKPSRRNLIIVAVILLVFGLFYFFKSIFIAAIVNGQPISRISVVQNLEKQNGKQMLSSLVTETLIYQEAKKQNINISQSEIDDEIKKIEDNFKKQGQSLEQVLTFQGMTKGDLIKSITIRKMVEKMVGKDIKVADKEVADYMEKNKSTIPEGEKPETIKEQLRQQKLNEKVQEWLDSLQKNAKIDYFVNY